MRDSTAFDESRVRRRIVTISCAMVSMFLSALACAFWIRGGWRIDIVTCGDRSREHGAAFISGQGRLVVGLNTRSEHSGICAGSWAVQQSEALVETAQWLAISGDNDVRGFAWGGFVIAWGPEYYRYAMISIPAWFGVVTPGLLATLLFMRQSRTRSLRRDGRCLSCGYDLRASPITCPECGTARGAENEPE